jgi:disulfide oxidoreductase YuzD
MARRFGERATIEYIDASDPATRDAREELIMRIHDQRLLYPVTVIDGEIVYDGAVSYPAILRAVEAKMSATA